ncbi:hypothetical protein [uncultured Robinsoniella sp.]
MAGMNFQTGSRTSSPFSHWNSCYKFSCCQLSCIFSF